MALYIFSSKSAAVKALAQYIQKLAWENIQSKGAFSIVLSGGSTPKELYQTLSAAPFRENIPWPKIYFFIGDERYVSDNDAESNYGMIEATLLHPLKIQPHQIHKYDTTLPPQQVAAAYQENIEKYFGNGKIVFDLVLLGLGDNAHTASLFPQSEILNDKKPGVKAVYIPETSSTRISMNAPMINQSQHIAFLVTGSPKATAVHQVIKGERKPLTYPAQLIGNNADWYLDETAARLL